MAIRNAKVGLRVKYTPNYKSKYYGSEGTITEVTKHFVFVNWDHADLNEECLTNKRKNLTRVTTNRGKKMTNAEKGKLARFHAFIKENEGQFVLADIHFRPDGNIIVKLIRKGNGVLFTKNIVDAKTFKTVKGAEKASRANNTIMKIIGNGKLTKHF